MATDKKLNSPDVWIIIPSYNVGDYLGNVLQKTKQYIPEHNIVVVDDGSEDGTVDIARQHNVVILSNPNNMGKGFALKTGIGYIIERKPQWVITMDGDGQHDPEILQAFISRATEDIEDIIIGERRRHGGMPWDRRFSNYSTSKLLSIVTGVSIKDAQCGYRLIRGSFIDVRNLKSNNYDFETECLLQWANKKARFGWLPVPTIYSGAPSSMNRVRDTFRFLRVVFKDIFS
ncbi:MAG: glycosyltransferase family 2 protein [Calditrichaeota bacterium]|nr:glycosyltransferase family 2 protein [Calditrichota bacterium]MBT7615716.1 glycosyltransferase family 2 protein [Calditrichota bacterium]